MATVVERMNCMRYDRGPSGPVPLPSELLDCPSWEQVQAAVRRMESDQGYYCRERNIIRSRRKVLEIARAFFETGDFAKVAAVASRAEAPKRPRPGRARFAGPLFDSLDPSGRGADPEQS